MNLTDLDLGGCGAFKDEFATFAVHRYFLECDWDYILGDDRLYWRIHHNGKGYLQTEPPGGTYWLRSPGKYDPPPWLVFVLVDGDADYYFTNFWGPRHGAPDKDSEPDDFKCVWQPERAVFTVRNKGISVQTELGICHSVTAAIMKVALSNHDKQPHKITLIPMIKPWLTSAQPVAWDMPWLYQSAVYDNATNSVLFEMRNPEGYPERRRRLRWLCDKRFDKLCVEEGAFVGKSSLCVPQALAAWPGWASCRDVCHYGDPLFASLATEIKLDPGESWQFTTLLADGDEDIDPLKKASAGAEEELTLVAERKEEDLRRFSIQTPDPAFNRYVNEFLALQQQLVLRRGWPSEMMGVRDAAQDYTGVAAWYPQKTRKMILTILETQRSDGSFLRQFSTAGRHGKHDERPYADSGLWVWELVYEYACQTRDFSVLQVKLPFLDDDRTVSVLDHLVRLLGYYMDPGNLGEHSLCKIYGGDWNDSVNRAGLAGRGESVMVSCHLIYCLRQAAKLFSFLLDREKGVPSPDEYAKFAEAMKLNVRKAALNKKGFLNGVYSDTGRWFFSDCDPDGRERLNVPVNAFGIIAGIFTEQEIDRLLDYLRGVRMDFGHPLFTPPIGDPPMEGLGRIGSGDLRAGLGENGTCYNHACHGFLSRALAAAGRGDAFYDVMQYMFPYDQSRHPVEQALTAPYAIVNVYLTAPGREGRGGDTFFSGGIAVAIRNVFQGMLGVHAEPEGLNISPCFPDAWKEISGRIVYDGKPLQVSVRRTKSGVDILVDGKKTTAVEVLE